MDLALWPLSRPPVMLVGVWSGWHLFANRSSLGWLQTPGHQPRRCWSFFCAKCGILWVLGPEWARPTAPQALALALVQAHDTGGSN